MIDAPSIPFLQVARSLATITASLSPHDAVASLAGLLRSIDREEDLYAVTVWLVHGPLPPHDPRRLAIGGSLIRQAYALYAADASADPDSLDHALFQASRSMAGGTAPAVMLLVAARRRAGLDDARSEGLSVAQTAAIYDQLAAARGTAPKIEMLAETWRMMGDEEIGLFLAILDRTGGGGVLPASLVELAIAAAFDADAESVRYAAMIEGDAGRAALRARDAELELAEILPFQPIEPMLPSPLDRDIDLIDGEERFLPDPRIDIADYVVEDRLEGIRAQAHIRIDRDAPRVAIVARDGSDLTASFPDASMELAGLPHGTVLDGLLMALDADGAPAHGDLLRARLGARRVPPELIAEHPAIFLPFDLLVLDDRPLLGEPLERRRELLEELAARYRMPLPEQRPVGDWDDVEREYLRARARGNDGIILKRRLGGYEYGRRGTGWLEGRKESGALAAVIRYVNGEEGRRGPITGYTFGVWLRDDRGERLVNIGRGSQAYIGAGLDELDRRLRPLLGKRFGTTYEVPPAIVCEIVYDAIERSPRTEAGFTLRAPRIRRVLWELDPPAAASVREVETRYEVGLRPGEADQGRGIAIPPQRDDRSM